MCKLWNVLKIKITAALLILALATVAIPVTTVHAAAPKIEKSYQFRLYKKDQGMPIIPIRNASDGKITKLKNSKPSVAKVSIYNKNELLVQLKSAGSTKVSFYFAGKKLSTKIIVKAWESPCKSFKVGNKDYAKAFEKSELYNLNNQKKDINVRIKITPKKGWKLLKIERIIGDFGVKKIKNNSKTKLSIKKKGTGIVAYFRNTKTGEEKSLELGYSNVPIPNENWYQLRIK